MLLFRGKMAKNRFFNLDQLDTLLDHYHWQVVSTQCKPEIEPVRDRKHEAWMQGHTHSHLHTEIMFVLRGTGKYGYEGKVYSFNSGTAFCFGPGEAHDLERPEWATDCQMLWVTLLGRRFLARITSFRRDLPQGPGTQGHLVMAEDSGLVIHNPLADILCYGAQRPEVRTLQVRAGLLQLASALIDHGDDPNQYPEEMIQRRVVRMLARHIDEVGGARLAPADVARMSGYSKSHFMRMFRAMTGRTLQQHIDEARLYLTEEWEQRGHQQQEIAAHLGFATPASFCRWRNKQRGRVGEQPARAAAESEARRENLVQVRIVD
jgi:AraC-like DNA-binding protein/mannose-6-phosphate isomerase-like protein (cupin superfamily)